MVANILVAGERGNLQAVSRRSVQTTLRWKASGVYWNERMQIIYDLLLAGF